ncbi:glycosyltransferase family 39 protein [bacterium]|nr:glycosyltransferase family 39 protein [bacterium]
MIVLLPFLTGLALTGIAWPRRKAEAAETLLLAALALGLGLGAASLTFFASLVAAGTITSAFFVTEVVLLLVLGRILLARNERSRDEVVTAGRGRERAPRLLVAATVVMLGLAVAAYVVLFLDKPNGGWDAWMIWNLRARFLYRGGEHWKDAFSTLLDKNHFHADYPLLLPALVARGWTCAGAESRLVPVAIAAVFTGGTIALLGSSVAVLRGKTLGLLATIAIAGTPDFLHYGGSLCSDVPLAFFVLATLVLLAREDQESEPTRGFPFLAGLSAGLAAWTKNEGLLFLALIVPVRLATHGRSGLARAVRELLWLGAGLAAPLAALAYFKLALAPTNDLIEGQSAGGFLEKVADVHRWAYIAREMTIELVKIEHWGTSFLPVLAGFIVIVGAKVEPAHRRSFALAAWVTALLALGYFLVYVASPHKLEYHVGTSHRRLIVQLVPAGLFALFLAVRAPAPSPGTLRDAKMREPGKPD